MWDWRRYLMLLLGLCGLVGLSTQAVAAVKWCIANQPNAIFCEDWDRYCTEPPADPTQACPTDSPHMSFLGGGNTSVWQTWFHGCSFLTMTDKWFGSMPFAGQAPSQGYLGNSTATITQAIRNKFGVQYKDIMGTDQYPLVLEYVLDCLPGRMKMVNAYMELYVGTWQNLTDYITNQKCTSCGDTYDRNYQILCRQSPTPQSALDVCPPVATATTLPCLAVGVLAFLDPNPCHCGEADDHYSHTHHLSFFDGKQWWTLKQSLFPGTFPGSGDFVIHDRVTNNPNKDESEPAPNHVRLTIKSTVVKVELTYRAIGNPQAEYSWCEIPRQYLGHFGLLNMGFAEGCRLKNNLWECREDRHCLIGLPDASIGTSFDNIVISGGMGYIDPGACCIVNENTNPPSIGCVQANGEMDCDLTYGGQFKGSGTVCESTPCCPPFLPDHDMDGDVDLEDFGWFQTCLSYAAHVDPPTVPCKCANLDGDLDVDTADFAVFANCLSGPGITADTGCIP